jgi:hypothetical protein
MATNTGTVEIKSVGFRFGKSTLRLGVNLVWVPYSTILLLTPVEYLVAEINDWVVV